LATEREVITDFLQNKIVFVSFISEMELLSKPGLSNDHVKILQAMLNSCVLIDFNNEIKSEAIKLRRHQRLKIPDAIVASTAMYMKLPLLTADKDFKKVSGIEVLFLSI
jgi:predicted nucleic acid-binding protein